MGGSREFPVTVTRREVVAAALPLQEHWLPLSNLDLLLPPLDVSVFFCYTRPAKNNRHHLTFAAAADALKKSLAQTLVTYYAFAGEVVTNSAGEPEILCNNRGVDFAEAYADVELRDLELYDPDESVERKLVPKKKDGVICVQATELKCGGMVVGCSFDHRIADAHSTNMFFVSWAESAQSKPISLVPTYRRSLLSPRRPVRHDPSIDDLFVLISSLPPPKNALVAVNRIYHVAADDIDRIQAVASAGTCKRRSKLEAFSAYLWRLLGGGGGRSRGARPDAKTCSMGIVVDGRSRLGCDGKRGDDVEGGNSSMATYFGNVLSIPYATLGAEELGSMALSEVADAVHECLSGAVTREHFLGLIDWVEAHRPEPAVAKIYCMGDEKEEEEGEGRMAFVVSSGQRFPVTKVDFGWGRPVFGSYHFPWGGNAGYVMPMPSARGNGDWVVYAHLARDLVEVLEAEAGDVFRPLTSDYIFALTD